MGRRALVAFGVAVLVLATCAAPAAWRATRRELDRLLEGFVERFGSPPISNSASVRRASAKNEEEDVR